jgi:hypothetical protein
MTSTPPNDPRQRSTRSLTSRTSLLTAAAIAGVLLAGTAAVAANIGILNAADSSTMGDLTATDELLPAVGADADTATVAAEMAPSTPTASPSAGTAQQYDIAGTGTVWVMTTRSGLALDHVVTEPGWSSVLTQGDLRSLQVDFTNGDRTIVFTAALGVDGAVVVDVTEPTTVLAQTPALTPSVGATPTTAASAQYDDDDQYEEHDEYEDEDHEYEGADDDD